MFADALRAAMNILCQDGEVILSTSPARTASGGMTYQPQTRAIRGHWSQFDKSVLASGVAPHKRVAFIVRDPAFEIQAGARLRLPDEAGAFEDMEILSVATTPYNEAWIVSGN